MDDIKIIEEDANVWLVLLFEEKDKIDEVIGSNVYEFKGKTIIIYEGNHIEVKKITAIEKLYYELYRIKETLWKNIDTAETFLKIYDPWRYEFESKLIKHNNMSCYDYDEWKYIIENNGEYNKRWSEILIKNQEEFEMFEDIYKTYAPVYCNRLAGISFNGADGNVSELLLEIRKSKIDRLNKPYTLFNEVYLEDRILALEILFQHPITEYNLMQLDESESKGESVKDLYEIVKIYPYIRIEECFKKDEKFKDIYIRIKNKLEDLNEGELLEEVSFDVIEIYNKAVDEQYELEFQELQDTKDIENKAFIEARISYAKHRRRERNPKLVKESKAFFKKNNNGRLFCQVCGFDFEKMYGERGNGFIEAHHEKPVAGMEEGASTRIKNMKMACSNCHRMLHKNSLITIEELKSIISNNK